MKRKKTFYKSSWGIVLTGTIFLCACTGPQYTARATHNEIQREIIANPPDVSPDFIPVSVKNEPRHRTFGNKYWRKLNRGIIQALPSYSAENYMKRETATASNKIKQTTAKKVTSTLSTQ